MESSFVGIVVAEELWRRERGREESSGDGKLGGVLHHGAEQARV